MARTKPTSATPPVADPAVTPSDGRVEAPPATAPTTPATPKKDAPRSMRELRLATEARRRVRAERGLENPLREGLRLERVPEPSIFVLFGATGDLAHRKVVPALFQLWRTHLLPHEFTVICVGRRPYTDDAFRTELKASLDQFSRVLPVDQEAWDDLASRISYHRGDFNDPATYSALADRLDEIDNERGTRGNRLYYLATQPSAFAEIVAQLGRAGLDHERHEGGWRRVVIEKPFGRDLDSAIRLNREVGKVFRERQVYRIDHYLGKETVRNLLVFRFGNGIFEPIWNRRHIDHVQITVAESIGVEGRGAFYEETGASRDFLQNHLLQLLSLVAMEPPTNFDADALRDEKVKVIRAVAEKGPTQVRTDVVRGQYGPGWVSGKPVVGYRQEAEVDPESETETFIAARLMIDDWRWSGVPFYLRMGKRLPKRATEIAIQFKEVPHQLFRESASDPEPNLLAMRIQPDEGIMLRFAAKVPGLGIDVRNVTMDFTYGSAFQTDSPDAYETLILDALLGDASLFTRADEVEQAWSIVDPIIAAWAEEGPPDFPSYEAGTWGPAVADDLLAREGRRWRRI
jgi:glucose-6-phosphate 1-dehydrogenase